MSRPVPPVLKKCDGERLGDLSRVDDEEEEPRSSLAPDDMLPSVFRLSTFLAALSFRFAFLRFAPKEGATGTMPAIVEPSDDRRHCPRRPLFGSETQKSETKRKRGKERRRPEQARQQTVRGERGAWLLLLIVDDSTQMKIAEPLTIRFFEIGEYKYKAKH